MSTLHALGALVLIVQASAYFTGLPRRTGGFRSALTLRMADADDGDVFVPDKVEKCCYTGRGCILLAQPEEKDPLLNKQCVLIFEAGKEGEGAQGVVLGKQV
tara:strand:- start:98 stop:403 length:306 start_codon:yes stop_codon:yes gene_type:complete